VARSERPRRQVEKCELNVDSIGLLTHIVVSSEWLFLAIICLISRVKVKKGREESYNLEVPTGD